MKERKAEQTTDTNNIFVKKNAEIFKHKVRKKDGQQRKTERKTE